MKQDDGYLTRQIAENLTVAKLGERGFVATTLAGNAPNIDILACKNGKAIPVQVKAAKTGSVSLKADRFLEIELKEERQIINGRREMNPSCLWVIIFGRLDSVEFFICRETDIAETVEKKYSGFLKRHDAKRPRNTKSYHHALKREHLAKFKDNWELFDKEV